LGCNSVKIAATSEIKSEKYPSQYIKELGWLRLIARLSSFLSVFTAVTVCNYLSLSVFTAVTVCDYFPLSVFTAVIVCDYLPLFVFTAVTV
jgi:hypothetical protein